MARGDTATLKGDARGDVDPIVGIGDWLEDVLDAAAPSERLDLACRWAQTIAGGPRGGRLVAELGRQVEAARERGGTRTPEADEVIRRSHRMQDRLDIFAPLGRYWMHSLSGLRLTLEMVLGDEPASAEWAAWVGVCAVVVTFDDPGQPARDRGMAEAVELWFGIDGSDAWLETFEGLRADWTGTVSDLVATADRLSRSTG